MCLDMHTRRNMYLYMYLCIYEHMYNTHTVACNSQEIKARSLPLSLSL